MNLEELERKNAELEKRIKAAEDRQKAQDEARAAILAAQGDVGGHGLGGSDERKALRYFGVGHVKDLLSVNTGHPMFQHVPAELKFLVRDLKKSFDVSRMIQQTLKGENLDRGPIGSDSFTAASVKGVLDGSYYAKNVLAPKLKAFGTGAAGEGAEWVPTIVASTYIEEFELERQVMQQFRQVNMPSSPFDVPIQTDVTVARRQAESCDPADNVAAANFGTGKITLDAEKLVEYMCLPEELNEDSAPNILGLVRTEVTEAQQRAFERAILDGDTTGPHMDTDVTGSVGTVGFGAANVTTAKLREMRENMGKFGVSESQLAWFVNSRGYHQMRDLPEVTTVEKFGPAATILRGALAGVDGVPIFISEWVRSDLDANGVHSGVALDDTHTVVHLINRSRFMWGVRRPIRVRAVTDPTPPGDRWLVASWWRGDFKGHAQSASEVSTVLGIEVGA
jgi:hypothetical protein